VRRQGLNDPPRRDLERRSSRHKGIFFEVPKGKAIRRSIRSAGAELDLIECFL
jgi:hypothetical protein